MVVSSFAGRAPSPVSQLVKSSELAAAIGISKETLRLWVRQGKTPEPERINGRLFWHRDAVQAWLASFRKKGA